MFKKYSSSVVVFVSLLLLWNQGAIVADAKTTVKIVPDYPGSSSFGIHCESRDDDLGSHIITQGSYYSFSFKPSVLPFVSTLFHCSLNWEGRGLSFAIYNEDRDLNSRCSRLCLWKVRKDGVSGYKEGEDNPDMFFPWTR
ncbi:hypothetical protein CDL15_Pgr012962 [Punica granatum]|nr:hypothetical protein CDL15_Pgr012962 [Punica granatum]